MYENGARIIPSAWTCGFERKVPCGWRTPVGSLEETILVAFPWMAAFGIAGFAGCMHIQVIQNIFKDKKYNHDCRSDS